MARDREFDLRSTADCLDMMADVDALVTDTTLPLAQRDRAARVANRVRSWLSVTAPIAPVYGENNLLSDETIWGEPTPCSSAGGNDQKQCEQTPRLPERSSDR